MATTKTQAVQRGTREDLVVEIEQAMHGGAVPVAVALTDLDDFASINTVHGREAGDKVLAAWERALTTNVPEGARVVKIGGDEYAVVLPGLSAENALVLCEEIRGHFGSREIAGVDGLQSVSIGVASRPPHGATADDVLRAAGEALYRAKREGRDRVALYVEEKITLKSNYYSRATLARLAKLSASTERTEASLLREALDDLLEKYRDSL